MTQSKRFGFLVGVVALLAFAPAAAQAQRVEPGDLIVSDLINKSVLSVDPESGDRTVISSNSNPAGGAQLVFPHGLAVEEDGSILVSDPAGGPTPNSGIIRINPTTGQRSYVSRNASPAGGPSFFGPLYLDLEEDGDIIVSDQDAFAEFRGGVIRVNPATGARTLVSANGSPAGGPSFTQPNGVDVDADGSIVVSDPSTREIVRINPATGARTLISSNDHPEPGPDPPTGLPDPVFTANLGLAIEASGNILVANNSNPLLTGQPPGVLRVDPDDGTRTRVSVTGQPAGDPVFGVPMGITVQPSSGRIFVADTGRSAVIGVDPLTGARQLVSGGGVGAGPALVFPGADIETYGEPPDTELTGAVMTARKTQPQRGKKIKVILKGGAAEAVTGVARGSLGKRLKLKPVTRSTGAGKRAAYALVLASKRANRKAMATLKRGKDLRAKLSLTLTDAADNEVTKKRTVRLTRR